MSAGTITLTNGSAIVGGTGTSFATELAAGDFIVSTVGGVPYTLPVKSVESNAQLTLVSNFTGPTQSGAAWSAVPRVALNMVTAALVAQSAEALRGLNYDKQNWQQVYSAAGNITVKLPDGTTFTGPSWKYLSDNMATKSGGAVPVNQGGTGSTTASGARTNLELGNSATKNVGSNSGDVVTSGSTQPLYRTTLPAVGYNDLGDYGYKATSTLPPDSVAKTTTTLVQTSGWTLGVSYGIYNSSDNSPENAAHLLIMTDGGGYLRRYYFYNNGDIVGPSGKFYSEKNTTVDTNGFLKKASPIVRLFGDGTLKSNNEAEGVTATRKSAGVYRVAGSLGLNPEGWTVEIPQDMNGNFLCFVDISTDEDGVLTVSTFKRRFDVDSAMIVAGEPMDIPDGRWIDLRLDMPDDSIWNRKQAEYHELEKFTGFDGS
ncbi:phage tail protein [Enterobacter asburiae]|uniref:phage tail fiber protein n=1 Tax=Enterobacter asburiae TaxID=61645 RepID=UPI002FFA4F69